MGLRRNRSAMIPKVIASVSAIVRSAKKLTLAFTQHTSPAAEANPFSKSVVVRRLALLAGFCSPASRSAGHVTFNTPIAALGVSHRSDRDPCDPSPRA